jgi:hypothetical protein
MGFRAVALRRLSAVLLLLSLAACGGGGGGGGGSDVDGGDGGQPVLGELPTLSQDVLPSGQRIDVSALNLFPVQSGNEWTYQNSFSGGVPVTRTVTRGPDEQGNFVLTETDPETGDAEPDTFRITASGIEDVDPLDARDVWPGVYAALPRVFDYPTPLYPVGGERKVVRQGDMGADLDGDGRNDFFRIELSQVFRGFESIAVLGRDTEVAHFSNRFAVTISTTRDGSRSTIAAVEEAYFAPGLGLVRSERSATDSAGGVVIAPYTLTLATATVDGVRTDSAGSARVLTLLQSSLIYDSRRGVYYASLPSASDPSDRIAVIDAATGAVRSSATVGSEPGPMAIASDGASMYVGLSGTGEVVQLALPSLTEIGRLRLPQDAASEQLRAQDITASPVSPGVFAVSLQRILSGPLHAGVVLVRDLVMQPVRTQEGPGSNRIAFGSDGQWIYGYDNEATEFSLRRIEVLANGLAERKTVPIGPLFEAGFDVFDGRVIIGSQVYAADASLALLGTIENGDNCVALRGTGNIACRDVLSWTRLRVVDATSLADVALVPYYTTTSSTGWRLVAGAPGQVVVTYDSSAILFSSPLLR